jgi:hypothetical protein
LDKSEALSWGQRTRIALAHPALTDAKYICKGKLAKNRAKGQADAMDVLGAELGVKLDDIDYRPTKGQALSMLRTDIKDNWQSARMDLFIQDFTKRLIVFKGKILVFDESQRVLEVASIALSANAIDHSSSMETLSKANGGVTAKASSKTNHLR